MKKLVLLMLCVSFAAMAQNQPVRKASAFIPVNISGVSMSARTLSATYADTTQAISVRDWGKVYVGLETAANDSANILVKYAPSKDGATFDAPVTLDSLVTTGTVGKVKYIELPAGSMGAVAVKIYVSGQSWGAYSANPSATVTTKIIKKHQ